MPDFKDITWKDIKLLRGNGHIRTAEISYAATRDATVKVFERQRIQCTHVTHSGRHSGAIEAQKLGIIQEEIKVGGRWVHGNGKRHQFYLSNYPLSFALGMAGFKDKPFYLKRNEASPPIELQQKIFPFVKEAFGDPETESYKAWRQECIDEMNEMDQDEPINLRDIMPFENSSSEVANVPIHSAHTDLPKKSFLKLLLRLRRVILQDAVEYLCEYPNVRSPILEDSLFTSEEFLRFKQDVQVVLQRNAEPLPRDFSPNITYAISSQHQEENHFITLRDGQEQMIKELQRMGTVLDNLQASHQNHATYPYYGPSSPYGPSGPYSHYSPCCPCTSHHPYNPYGHYGPGPYVLHYPYGLYDPYDPMLPILPTIQII